MRDQSKQHNFHNSYTEWTLSKTSITVQLAANITDSSYSDWPNDWQTARPQDDANAASSSLHSNSALSQSNLYAYIDQSSETQTHVALQKYLSK